jgi:hypothetical protein
MAPFPCLRLLKLLPTGCRLLPGLATTGTNRGRGNRRFLWPDGVPVHGSRVTKVQSGPRGESASQLPWSMCRRCVRRAEQGDITSTRCGGQSYRHARASRSAQRAEDRHVEASNAPGFGEEQMTALCKPGAASSTAGADLSAPPPWRAECRRVR